MKRIYIILLLASINYLFSQEVYEAEYKLINQFKNIKFRDSEGKGSNGVDDMFIDNKGSFIFTDEGTSKILFINTHFEVTKTIGYTKPGSSEEKFFYLSDKYILMGFYGGYLYSVDGKIKEFIIPYENITFRYYQIIENLIIGEKDGLYYSYLIPESMDGELVFRTQEETYEYLTTREGFKIDRDFILYNGRLVTTIGKTFTAYFKEKTKTINIDTYFLRGIDKEGNYYFGNSYWTNIYNKMGRLKSRVGAKVKYPFTFPKIDPDGNIYYCHLNEDNNTVDLYKIDRIW